MLNAPPEVVAPVPPLLIGKVDVDEIPFVPLPRRIAPLVKLVFPVPPFDTLKVDVVVIPFVPLPSKIAPLVKVDCPVPPFDTLKVDVVEIPLVPLPRRIAPLVKVDCPVPPLETDKVPDVKSDTEWLCVFVAKLFVLAFCDITEVDELPVSCTMLILLLFEVRDIKASLINQNHLSNADYLYRDFSSWG